MKNFIIFKFFKINFIKFNSLHNDEFRCRKKTRKFFKN